MTCKECKTGINRGCNSIASDAAYDCWLLCEQRGFALVRRHVGWFEPLAAYDRGVSGRSRGRYQRAFHRALKAVTP